MLHQVDRINYPHINNRIRHALRIVDGPYMFQNFNAGRWRFTLTPHHPIPLYTGDRNVHNRAMMNNDTADVFSAILQEAFESVMRDVNNPNLLVHIYIHVDGVDQDFTANPGVHLGITLGEYLEDREAFRQAHQLDNELHPIDRIMDQFMAIVQSNEGAVLNNNTVITIYTYDVPRPGGAIHKYYTQDDLINKAACVHKINNKMDNLCFTRALILGKAMIEDRRNLFPNLKKRDAQLVRKCHELLTTLKLPLNSKIGLDDIPPFAKEINMGIHVFDITDGNHPRFVYHAKPDVEGPTPHIYLLYVNEHYHLITDINALIRIFKRNPYLSLCEQCFGNIDSRYPHSCETPVNTMAQTLYKIGNRLLPYFPVKSSERLETNYISKTIASKSTEKKIFYLDFETFVIGHYKHDLKRAEPLIPHHTLPDVADYLLPYTPYPFVEREMDTSLFRYTQQVNHCELQSADGTLTQTFNSIEETMEYLTQPQFNSAIVMAHFGSSFDFQFMMRYYLEKHVLKMKKIKAPLMRGNKIIKATITNDIELLDSYCFVSQGLANFPKIFGLNELKKGYFPHLFNLPHFWNYVGPMPDARYYEPDSMKPEKRDDFYTWYNQCVADMKIFNFQKEMKEYCHSDVTLLREGMNKFREIFMTLKNAEGDDISTDPFDYVSIAGVAFDGIYRRYFLPDNEIIVVPRPPRSIVTSKKLEWFSVFKDEHIQTCDTNGHALQFRLGQDKFYHVDGYCSDTNTVFFFWNCFYDGCNVCYDANMKTPHLFGTYIKDGQEKQRSIKFGEVYASTVEKVERFKANGYEVEEIWECQFNKFVHKNNIVFDTVLTHLDPLIPRDAYFGGRVNAVKLYYKCQGLEKIHYIDVTSMYPAVMSGEQYYYPVGCPTVVRPRIDGYTIPLNELFGVMKCKVTPPRHLYHPVLPTRSKSGKVLFDLNPTVGTWTHVELQTAVLMGYVINEVYEQHHFERRLNNLFKSYNETFFEIKRQAKRDGNKGLEAIAKLCINGPTGKWGFNPSKSKSNKIVRDDAELKRFLCGRFDSVGVNFLNDDVCVVSVSDNNIMSEHHKSNVYISAFITAYSRMKLYHDALLPLQEKVLYFDTDSVMYVSPTGNHLIPIDTTGALGLWTSEAPVDDHFIEFCATGPKCYALKSFSGNNDIAKIKGCFLHYRNQQKFTFDTLKHTILCKALNLDTEKVILHQHEKIMRKKYFEILVEDNKGKVMWFNYDKRVIVTPSQKYDHVTVVDTLPYNHMLIN